MTAPAAEKERERDNRDRHKDEGFPTPPKPSSSSNSNYLGSRGPGLKNNYLTGQQINPSTGNSSQQRTSSGKQSSLCQEII